MKKLFYKMYNHMNHDIFNQFNYFIIPVSHKSNDDVKRVHKSI